VHTLPTLLDSRLNVHYNAPEGENIIDIGCAENEIYFNTGISIYPPRC